MATSKNYGKKKGSDHFRDILNPYGEKSNYGKIGRRRRLSKLNVFFSIILSVTINHDSAKLRDAENPPVTVAPQAMATYVIDYRYE